MLFPFNSLPPQACLGLSPPHSSKAFPKIIVVALEIVTVTAPFPPVRARLTSMQGTARSTLNSGCDFKSDC
jgi:hypothetical protein